MFGSDMVRGVRNPYHPFGGTRSNIIGMHMTIIETPRPKNVSRISPMRSLLTIVKRLSYFGSIAAGLHLSQSFVTGHFDPSLARNTHKLTFLVYHPE